MPARTHVLRLPEVLALVQCNIIDEQTLFACTQVNNLWAIPRSKGVVGGPSFQASGQIHRRRERQVDLVNFFITPFHIIFPQNNMALETSAYGTLNAANPFRSSQCPHTRYLDGATRGAGDTTASRDAHGVAVDLCIRPTANSDCDGKPLKSAHVRDKGYVHNGRWMRILLSQDIRIYHTVDIFSGLDVDAKLLEWGIDFDEDKRRALEHFRGLPNSFGVVKGPFGAGKIYLDVVISMLLLSLDKKILAVSSANNAADSFIRKLDDELERLQRRQITVVKKAVVRIHSPGTVFVVKTSKRTLPSLCGT